MAWTFEGILTFPRTLLLEVMQVPPDALAPHYWKAGSDP